MKRKLEETVDTDITGDVLNWVWEVVSAAVVTSDVRRDCGDCGGWWLRSRCGHAGTQLHFTALLCAVAARHLAALSRRCPVCMMCRLSYGCGERMDLMLDVRLLILILPREGR